MGASLNRSLTLPRRGDIQNPLLRTMSCKRLVLFKEVSVQADPLPNWQLVLKELVVIVLRCSLLTVVGGIDKNDRRVWRGGYGRLNAKAPEQLMKKRLKPGGRELTPVNTKHIIVQSGRESRGLRVVEGIFSR